MGKLVTFLVGAITGAVGLGVAACLVDKYCNNASDSRDDDELEKNFETENTVDNES